MQWKSCTVFKTSYYTPRLTAAIKQRPNSSTLHFLHGTAIWRSKVTDKRPAYASFIQVQLTLIGSDIISLPQAAKLDPHNGEVFLYLGRYQKLVNRNTEWVIRKCASTVWWKLSNRCSDLFNGHVHMASYLGVPLATRSCMASLLIYHFLQTSHKVLSEGSCSDALSNCGSHGTGRPAHNQRRRGQVISL